MDGRRLVVAAVIVDDLEAPARVLATRRSGPEELAGRWEFPGGKVEPDELPQDALVREVFEELAVTVRVGAEIQAVDTDAWPINDQYAMRVWLAELSDGEPVAGDSHDLLRWVGADELTGLDWLDVDVAVAARVEELLRGRTDRQS